MDRSQARGATSVGPILMIAGAALILIGCVLPWFTVDANFARFGAASRSVTGTGMDTSDGTLFLVIAIGIALLGVVALIGKTRSARLSVSVIAGLGALFVGGVAVYNALTPKQQAIDEITKEIGGGTAAAAVRAFVLNLFNRGIVHIGVDAGIWIVVAGAAGALIGSAIAAASAGSVRTSMASAVSYPPAVAGWSSQAGPPSPVAPMVPTSPPEPPSGPVAEDADRPPES
jgi:hypothetical protein